MYNITFVLKSFRSLLIFSLFIVIPMNSDCQPENHKTNQKNSSELSESEAGATKVAMLGLFHFGGSSGDLASMKMADPFGKRRQDDIKELVAKLKEFQPTKILVEFPKKDQNLLKERYDNYISGIDTLKVNEVYQVGFRLANSLSHGQLYAIDYKLDLPGDELVEYCQRNDKMNEFETFIKDVQAYVAEENQILDTMSILEYLARTNADAIDQLTIEPYIRNILSMGDSINEAGASFAATWWKRNFVILKNITEIIDSKQDRILIIIGSGHRAVLKDLIIARSDMEYVEIGEYLK